MGPATRFADLASLLAIALVAGLIGPLSSGWLVPLVLAGVVAWSLGRGPTNRAVPSPRRSSRLALAVWWGCGLLPTILVAAAIAQAIGRLAVGIPAVMGSVALAGVTLALGLGARRWLAVTLPVLVLVSGVVGASIEASSPDGRGWATSSTIHGIHPWQATAIVIDGHGPFDITIGDYVEPDGRRGFDPQALAEHVEHTLHRIAQVHYADGPARAHEAFARARVQVVSGPPVREHASEPASQQTASRLHVRSGLAHPGSSVAFVCPGQVEGPRRTAGPRRSCPNKYASPGSAGLGLTARWPGYAEGRGESRASVARWLHWTRTSDATGHRVEAWEVGLLSAFVLIAMALVLRRPGPHLGLDVGASVLGLALVVLIALSLLGDGRAVAAVEPTGTLEDPWLGLLAVAAAPRGCLAARRGAIALLGGLTVVAATQLSGLVWLRGDALALAVGLADRLWQRIDLPLGVLEAVTGSILVWVLLVGTLRWWRAVEAELSPPRLVWIAVAAGSLAVVLVAEPVTLLPAGLGLWLVFRTWSGAGPRSSIAHGLAMVLATIAASLGVVSSLGWLDREAALSPVTVGLGAACLALALLSAVKWAAPVESPA